MSGFSQFRFYIIELKTKVRLCFCSVGLLKSEFFFFLTGKADGPIITIEFCQK